MIPLDPDMLFWWLAGVVVLLLILHVLEHFWHRMRLYR